MKKQKLNKLIIVLIALTSFTFKSFACTIFVLTDGNNTYFFNNEDNTNPNARIWFVSGGENHFGCGYVGYDDGAAQGGVNTEGLAFDWYAGKSVDYTPNDNLIPIKDSSSERMLETCSTVDEAIEFYKTYREPSFAVATIIIADKTGASVIIGARNGKLYFEKITKSRVLGWASSTFDKMYNDNTSIDLNGGAEILQKCMFPEEEGFNGGTKYSNSYNLKNGDMTFFDFGTDDKEDVTINLHKELEKGNHYYDMAELKIQIKEPIKPLVLSMNRLILFDDNFALENDAKADNLIEDIFSEAFKGNFPKKYFTLDERKEWMAISSTLKEIGTLNSFKLVEKNQKEELKIYSYVLDFEKLKVLWRFEFNQSWQIQKSNVLTSYN